MVAVVTWACRLFKAGMETRTNAIAEKTHASLAGKILHINLFEPLLRLQFLAGHLAPLCVFYYKSQEAAIKFRVDASIRMKDPEYYADASAALLREAFFGTSTATLTGKCSRSQL
jgi:hypothetical protein